MSEDPTNSWSAVTQKQDLDEQTLKQNEVLLEAIEADLNAIESCMEKAQARYETARARMARQREEGTGTQPMTESKKSPHMAPSEDHPIDEAEALPPEDHKHEHHKKLHREPKNSGALPDKVVNRQRWLAARSSEKRQRESAKRARELMRLRQRDRKMEAGYVPDDAPAEATAVAQPKAAPAAHDGPAPETVEEGAKHLAARLSSIHERVDDPKSNESLHSAVLKVLTCGRENYYTFKPEEVIHDLKKRGFLDDALVKECLGLLADESLKTKSKQIPLNEWLEHAKKVSSLKRKDDLPFKDVEAAYLGFLDGRTLALGEAELEAAEAELEQALQAQSLAAARYEEAWARSGLDQAAMEETEAAEFNLSMEEAEHFDAEHSHDKFESHGTKNAGALPDKVVSRDRWLAARNSEERAREAQKKQRDLGRSNARDAKQESAVPV
ncbi:Uncharacterized protein SCF082_LOCUS18920 [Durusdinium trenchii]|uniref:Uncharacterized protein n=1 Tax=Durusdinium trenchii TaxID=1381693 RepID=A0ABP0KT54_9DINO